MAVTDVGPGAGTMTWENVPRRGSPAPA